MTHFRWLLSVIGFVKWGFAFGLALMVVKTVFNLSMTGVQKYMIDEIFMEQQFGLLWPVLFVFLASVILYNLTHIIGEMMLNIHARKANVWLLQRYMESIHGLRTTVLQQERTGRLTQYYTQEVNAVTGMLGSWGIFSDGLQKLFSFVVLAVAVGWANPYILAGILVIGIVYIPLGQYFKPSIRQAAKEAQERRADIGVQIAEGIASTREVVAFHRIDWEKGIFRTLFERYFGAAMHEVKITNKQTVISDSLRLGTSFFVFAYGGYEVVRGELSIGMFIVVFQFSNQLMTSIGGLYQSVMQLPGSFATIERLRKAMDGEKRTAGSRTLQGVIQTIEFNHVGFRYAADTPPVLRNLSMKWKAEGKIAVVGTSGGGKSTIAQLLVRFHEPDTGELLINGIPLNQYSFESWSAKTAIVFQDPYLFPDTILNNVKMNLEGCSDEQVYEACRLSCIHDDIMKLPLGYGTSLGERGIKLSGGQRQRLAIARALLRDPELLILDESTSALDLETERNVMRNLDAVRKDRLTIVIAHRLSTVMNADQIYVLDKGAVCEQGTHGELLQRAGAYAELLRLAKTG